MFESYNNPYNPYNIYNPYYNQLSQQMLRQTPQVYNRQPNIFNLQGKVVDSLDVVKATDIPYDGSISYFPLADGTAIITKQLQQDGTSRVVVYKPVTEKEDAKAKYITENDLQEYMKDVNNKDSKEIKDIKEDMKTLKRKVEDMVDDIKEKKEK